VRIGGSGERVRSCKRGLKIREVEKLLGFHKNTVVF
jgi:hypothetical protein